MIVNILIVCKFIEDQKVEYCELIEGQKVEYCELIEDQKVEYCEVEIIEHQKVENINMLKSSRDEKYSLDLSKKKLKIIARERGVKNYENLSKSRLIKEINKLKSSKGQKKHRKGVSSLLLKGKRSIGFKPRKKKAKKMFISQQRLVVLLVIILLNTKVIVKMLNQYQLLDILILLDI